MRCGRAVLYYVITTHSYAHPACRAVTHPAYIRAATLPLLRTFVTASAHLPLLGSPCTLRLPLPFAGGSATGLLLCVLFATAPLAVPGTPRCSNLMDHTFLDGVRQRYGWLVVRLFHTAHCPVRTAVQPLPPWFCRTAMPGLLRCQRLWFAAGGCGCLLTATAFACQQPLPCNALTCQPASATYPVLPVPPAVPTPPTCRYYTWHTYAAFAVGLLPYGSGNPRGPYLPGRAARAISFFWLTVAGVWRLLRTRRYRLLLRRGCYMTA